MDIGALILMGGKNSRMNGNVKGLLKIKNSTFLEKIQETLNDFSSIYLSINDKFSKEQKQNFENMGFKIIEDIYKEIGPLGGIYSSLLNCKEEYLFITACDMPFITKNSIEVLCNKVDKNTDGVVFYDKNNNRIPLKSFVIYNGRRYYVYSTEDMFGENMIKKEIRINPCGYDGGKSILLEKAVRDKEGNLILDDKNIN